MVGQTNITNSLKKVNAKSLAKRISKRKNSKDARKAH